MLMLLLLHLLLLQLAHEHGRLFAALQQAQEKLVRYCHVRATQKEFYTFSRYACGLGGCS